MTKSQEELGAESANELKWQCQSQLLDDSDCETRESSSNHEEQLHKEAKRDCKATLNSCRSSRIQLISRRLTTHKDVSCFAAVSDRLVPESPRLGGDPLAVVRTLFVSFLQVPHPVFVTFRSVVLHPPWASDRYAVIISLLWRQSRCCQSRSSHGQVAFSHFFGTRRRAILHGRERLSPLSTVTRSTCSDCD